MLPRGYIGTVNFYYPNLAAKLLADAQNSGSACDHASLINYDVLQDF
jgi:hypothetical protein